MEAFVFESLTNHIAGSADWRTDVNDENVRPVSVLEEYRSSRKSHHFHWSGVPLYVQTDSSSSIFTPFCSFISAAAQINISKNQMLSDDSVGSVTKLIKDKTKVKKKKSANQKRKY